MLSSCDQCHKTQVEAAPGLNAVCASCAAVTEEMLAGKELLCVSVSCRCGKPVFTCGADECEDQVHRSYGYQDLDGEWFCGSRSCRLSSEE